MDISRDTRPRAHASSDSRESSRTGMLQRFGRSAHTRDGGLEILRQRGMPRAFRLDASLADPAATVPHHYSSEVTWEPGEEPDGGDRLARRLAEQPPGPELAQLLDGLDPAAISQAVLLEAISASERQQRWDQARSSRFIAEADRRSFLGDVGHHELANELSMRLSISTRAADQRVSDAVEIFRGAPVLWRGMEAGAIDRSKAAIILAELSIAEDEVSVHVLDEKHRLLLEWARTHTHGQLRAKAKKTAAQLIPLAAVERRHEVARTERDVWLQPDVDGMAQLIANLPGPDAMAAFTVIDRMAGPKDHDDARNRGQRRADSFAELFRTLLDADATPLGSLPTAQRSRPHLLVTVQQTPCVGAAPGRPGARPGAPGLGQVSLEPDSHTFRAPPGRSMAGHAVDAHATAPTGRALGTSDLALSGTTRNKSETAASHPHPAQAPTGTTPSTSATTAIANADPRRDPCQAPHTRTPRTTSQAEAPRPIVTLDGFGTITPAIALRALTGARISFAIADSTTGQHRRLVQAPSSLTAEEVFESLRRGVDLTHLAHFTSKAPPRIGNVVDWKVEQIAQEWRLSTNRYRGSTELIRHVLLRDGRCTFPTCRLPAWRCDLDHIAPFDESRPAQDQTTEDNLHAVCRSHHRLKTLFGWRARRDARTGDVIWTSPSGFAKSSRPEYLEGPV